MYVCMYVYVYVYVYMYMYMYMYVYIYIYVYTFMYNYIYICIERERERERGHAGQRAAAEPEVRGHGCHILPFQPILRSKYFPPEPANTAKHSPKSISEGGRIW